MVLPEQRIRVAATRVRIADVCVIDAAAPREQVIKTPPLLCVEILSPDDTIKRLQSRIDDYLAMGVPCVWVIAPETRRAWIHQPGVIREVAGKRPQHS